MKPLVIYHGACRDGFTAAWVVRKRFPHAEFFAGYYGNEPPDVEQRDVIIVDFSYKRPVLEKMLDKVATMTILDHHKTAEADLAGLERGGLTVQFDMNRSGAGMAWDYYFEGHQRPWIVNYIEDRDLWRHAMPHSKVVNAWLSVLPFDWAQWDMAEMTTLEEAIEGGQSAVLKTEQYCREVGKNARFVSFEGHVVPAVNAPQVDISELLHSLVTASPAPAFAVGWFQTSDGEFAYSLRSLGDFDVSAIAKKFGGGGHRNAAGFKLPYTLFGRGAADRYIMTDAPIHPALQTAQAEALK